MTRPERPAATRAAREAWQAMADLVLDNQRRREVSERVGLSFGKMQGVATDRRAGPCPCASWPPSSAWTRPT